MWPRLSYLHHATAGFGVVVFIVALGGCNAGRVSQENSRLRRENLELTETVDARNKQISRLQGQVEAMTAKVNAPRPALANVKPSDLPVATRITFGRYSGAYDEDGDRKDDTVRIYVVTEDQKGRFIPVAGKAVLQVVSIEPDAGASELVKKVYDPKALDEAYTTGLTGTHYTLEAKLPDSLPPSGQVTVKVSLTDAATGAALTAQMVVKVRAGP